MIPLSQNDSRALLSAVEIIYKPTNIDLFPTAVLSAIGKVLACNTVCYNEVHIPESRMSWITEPANALPDPLLREKFNRHLQEHPLIAHSGMKDVGGSLRISDFLTQTQFHRLALYNEYYRPLNVEYQLGTIISIDPKKIVALGLDRDHPDFSENERLCLDILRPHLAQAYRNLHTLDLMKRTIEESGKKLVLVNRSGRVQAVSDDVWQVLSKYCDISHSSGYLPDLLRNWTVHERSRFEYESGDLSPSLPLVISINGHNLIVHFIWGGTAAGQDLLLLEETPTNFGPAFSDDSQLTPRETEILAWLSQGKTNAEIGLALSISPRTVKKHLEHIYNKLKVHRRIGAVARSISF
jgi:DNA-binding CsgD family transcriptional regulator